MLLMRQDSSIVSTLQEPASSLAPLSFSWSAPSHLDEVRPLVPKHAAPPQIQILLALPWRFFVLTCLTGFCVAWNS